MSLHTSKVWFTGPVAEAVKTVTEKSLVFLVYIYDSSEKSKQLDKVFEDQELLSVMKNKTVALKMEKSSDNARMFSQLYPVYDVPVVYFILQGKIEDFGMYDITSEHMIIAINKLSPQIDVKAKLEEAREKRAKEEEKQAREREIKRRQEGKLAQQTHETLQQKQDKLYQEKIKKERKEEEEYKRKVREQIAKDREDQVAARKKEKELANSAKRHEKAAAATKSSGYYDHSNLNIKQLDGSSLRHSFSPSETLASITQWIDSARTDGDTPYKLFVQFPNRNFDIGDEQRTLLELKLCPSATLIMKPIKNVSTAYAASSTVSRGGGGGGWMNYLHSASDYIYNSISQVGNYLVTPTATPEHGQRLGTSSSNSGDPSPPNTTMSPSSSSYNNRRINTLNSKKFDGDNNNDRQTYNGNSVNQE